MLFTIVVDVDPNEFPEGDLKEKVKANIENNIGPVDSIGQGDQSNVGWHYITRWHEDDFRQMLEDNGIFTSDENVSTLMYACRHMDDSQVESGWEAMQWAMNECSFESEFKCKYCEEEITEEENGMCDFCREEEDNNESLSS